MYLGSCIGTCPTEITVPDTSARICEPCTSPCSKCNNYVTNCTKCISGHYLYQFTCVTTCPNPLLPDVSTGECSPCKGKYIKK